MTLVLKNTVDHFCTLESIKLNRLREIANDIDSFQILDFTSDDEFETIPQLFKIKKVIYYIEIIGITPQRTLQDICDKIAIGKKRFKELKLPKVNMENAKEDSELKVLYVGKSLGNFSVRLKQHFGRESKKTYALHFNRWKDITKLNLSLRLHYLTLNDKLSNEDNHLLELLETSLHYKLKPILGRTGH